MHEVQLHECAAFLTLTYQDEHLPASRSLVKKHMQDFVKRYRRSVEPERISVFYIGEYGEECASCHRNHEDCRCGAWVPALGRPHYHAIIFGHDFPDKTRWKETDYGVLWTSATLETLWGKGYCSIGSVTFESAAYVARYAVKKITGSPADSHYQWIDDDGEVHQREPEFAEMSRRPAIAKRWFEKYRGDVYPHDSVVMRGHENKVPRYYDKQMATIDPDALRRIKWLRIAAANTRQARIESGPPRLAVREKVKKAQIRSLKRDL